jgi:hypothetical protein
MSSDGGVNRPLPSLILLGIVDFVCILLAAESYNSSQFMRGTAWLVAGVVASAIGYYWPSIKKWRITRESDSATKEMTLDDPRIYLGIEPASEVMFPRTPFILRNEGKYEAHHVAIQPFKLCRKVVGFPEVAVVSVGKPEKALPTVEDDGGQMVNHNIFHWLNKDWDASGTLADEDWPIPITIKYSDPLDKRHFEGTVTLMFHPWTYNMNKKSNDKNLPNFILRHQEPGWEFINPQFNLVG